MRNRGCRAGIHDQQHLPFLSDSGQSRAVCRACADESFSGATALLALSVVLAAPLRVEALWLAAWMVLVLTGTFGMLGLPKVGEWRLLTDDRL